MNWRHFLPEEKEELIPIQVKIPASLHRRAEKKLIKQDITWKALFMAFLQDYVQDESSHKD